LGSFTGREFRVVAQGLALFSNAPPLVSAGFMSVLLTIFFERPRGSRMVLLSSVPSMTSLRRVLLVLCGSCGDSEAFYMLVSWLIVISILTEHTSLLFCSLVSISLPASSKASPIRLTTTGGSCKTRICGGSAAGFCLFFTICEVANLPSNTLHRESSTLVRVTRVGMWWRFFRAGNGGGCFRAGSLFRSPL
jgi:hypothetical protein